MAPEPHYEPGSIGFSHSKGLIGWAIRFGEYLRFRKGNFWNHAFIVSDRVDENGKQLIIQALGGGVNGSKPLSQVAPGGRYEIVPLPEGVAPEDVLNFAEAQIGSAYGWLSIASTAIRIILPRWLPLPSIRSNSTWYCSALAAESLRCGGWIYNWPDIYNVVPSSLYAALSGLTPKELKILETETSEYYG